MVGDFFLTQWIFLAMRWLCESVLSNSVFLTILISTVVLRLLTLPSDIKQRKTVIKTAEIQPRMAELQARYKDDPRKLQIEQSKLMKESGTSMFGGCLPMIITLVLLFCFVAAFRFWGYEQNVKILVEMNSNYTQAQESGLDEVEVSKTFKEAHFLWINNIWQPDNAFSPVFLTADEFFNKTVYGTTKKLIYFKENKEEFNRLVDMGLFYDEVKGYSDFTDEEKEAALANAKDKYNYLTKPLIHEYEGYTNGFLFLPVLATLFQFLYAWYAQKTQQKKNTPKSDTPQPGASTAKYMMYFMPILTFIFCMKYTAAFAIYWTLSSITMLIVNVAINYFINKKSSEATEKN